MNLAEVQRVAGWLSAGSRLAATRRWRRVSYDGDAKTSRQTQPLVNRAQFRDLLASYLGAQVRPRFSRM